MSERCCQEMAKFYVKELSCSLHSWPPTLSSSHPPKGKGGWEEKNENPLQFLCFLIGSYLSPKYNSFPGLLFSIFEYWYYTVSVCLVLVLAFVIFHFCIYFSTAYITLFILVGSVRAPSAKIAKIDFYPCQKVLLHAPVILSMPRS